MLVILYKISEVYFRLLGTNEFHGKAKNERLRKKNCSKRRAAALSVAFTLSLPLLTSILKDRLSKDILCDAPQPQVERFSFQTV